MYPSEYAEQVAVCSLLSTAGVFYFSIPNEHRDVKTIPRLKKAGMVPGMPDLCILHDGTAYFLEMKRIGGRVDDHQYAIHHALERMGYHVAVAYGYADAVRIIDEWGIIRI